MDAAGTLDHSAAEAGASQPALGRIGGYRFFSDEEDPDIDEDAVPEEDEHLSALSAVFNADPMSYEPGDEPGDEPQPEPRIAATQPTRRSSEIPSLSKDDLSEELAIKSIFL